MDKILTRVALLVILIMTCASLSLAAPLPPNRTLTIQLSSVDYSGQHTLVDSTTTQTDAQGKFTFSFSVVPSADRVQYLYLQVFDGSNLLRQSLVPAPDNGAKTDAAISEISDLQTRALLNAKAGSNGLTPFHMVAALTMLRSQAISQDDVNKIVNAVNAAANAFYAAIYASSQGVASSSSALVALSATAVQGTFSSRTIVQPTKLRTLNPITGVPPKGNFPPSIELSITTEQVAIFNKELLAGLRRSMALFRKSVDDATTSDVKVEAAGRSAAMALLINELVAASASAGIPLETTEWAYMAAGAAAEVSLTQQGASSAVVSFVRLCFVNGMTLYQTARVVRSHIDALAALKISPPTLQRYFTLLSTLADIIPSRMRIDLTLYQPTLSDSRTYEVAIFNTFATRDVAYMSAMMQALTVGTNFDAFPLVDPELENLLSIVIGRMAATNGVMEGMTKTRLQSITGSGTNSPIGLLQMPIWLYLQQIPQYTYAPIVGISNGINSIPSPPLFDQFSGAYQAQMLMGYDLGVVGQRTYQDDVAAENAGYVINPARWYSFEAAANLKKNAITRRDDVLTRMSGLSAKEADAIMTISRGIGGYNFY